MTSSTKQNIIIIRITIEIVVRLTETLATGLNFIFGTGSTDVCEHSLVMSADDCGLKTLEVVSLVQHLVSLGIQVSDLADVLFALRLGHGTVSLGDLGVVLNDLHRLEITLELEQVLHNSSR